MNLPEHNFYQGWIRNAFYKGFRNGLFFGIVIGVIATKLIQGMF